MERTFEYRFRPNKQQEEAVIKVLRASRLAYNDALEEWKQHFEATGEYLSLYAQDKGYTTTTYPDISAVLLDQVLKRLHHSLNLFFKGRKEGRYRGLPRFKPVQRWNTIEFRDARNYLDGRSFKAGKQCGGDIRTVVHRSLEGEFRFARIVKWPSGWYLQCVCRVAPKPFVDQYEAIGLDMGITYLVADSDGNTVEKPKPYRRTKDVLHKTSRRYANAYHTVVVRDLQPVNMVWSHHFALSISDSSWGMLRQYLTDKVDETGGEVVAVPLHFTSQQSNQCREYIKKSLSARTHICPHCGSVIDRDVNAAQNILQARTGPSRKRETAPLQRWRSVT